MFKKQQHGGSGKVVSSRVIVEGEGQCEGPVPRTFAGMGERKSSLQACFLRSSLEAVPKGCIRPIYAWSTREADPKELGEESTIHNTIQMVLSHN